MNQFQRFVIKVPSEWMCFSRPGPRCSVWKAAFWVWRLGETVDRANNKILFFAAEAPRLFHPGQRGLSAHCGSLLSLRSSQPPGPPLSLPTDETSGYFKAVTWEGLPGTLLQLPSAKAQLDICSQAAPVFPRKENKATFLQPEQRGAAPQLRKAKPSHPVSTIRSYSKISLMTLNGTLGENCPHFPDASLFI